MKIFFTIPLTIVSFILLITINLEAASITSKANGNWNATGTWTGGIIPSSSDDVVINNNVTANVDASCNNMTVNSTFTLTLNGQVNFTINSNLINYGSINYKDGNTSASTVIIIKGGFFNTATGTLDESPPNCRLYFSGTSPQTFTNDGTLKATMSDLTVNNPAGLTIVGNINLDKTLNMMSGNIDITGYTLTLGTAANSLGTLNYTSGKIITGNTGGFKRWFASSIVSNVLFPVGTANNLNNITLSFTVKPTSSGTLTAKFIASDPGTNSANPLLDGSYIVNTYSPAGYWQIDNSGISGGTYTIGLEGQGFNVGGTSILNYQLLRVLKRPASGYDWSLLGSHVAGTGTNNDPTAWRSGLSGFSQFAFGGNTTDNPFAGALPVELSSFTSSVKDRNVILSWSTMSEQNNSGFLVERLDLNSNSGNNIWSAIGFVKGKNNAVHENNYTYSDTRLQTGKYEYRLKQIDFNGNYKYYTLNNIVEIGLPAKIKLSQNYPNPFNPVTKIDYELPADSRISVVIYDILGREVMSLVNENQKAGFYTVQFNTNTLASGMYFYRLISNTEGNQQTLTKKLSVIK